MSLPARLLLLLLPAPAAAAAAVIRGQPLLLELLLKPLLCTVHLALQVERAALLVGLEQVVVLLQQGVNVCVCVCVPLCNAYAYTAKAKGQEGK